MSKPPGRRKGRSVWLGKEPPDHLIEHQETVRFPVRADTAGMRLDLFLKMRLPWRSRESVHRVLRERDIRVSGARRRASYRLKDGEVVTVPNPPPPEDPSVIHDVALHIVYEDEDLVVLNKQPDVVVHPVGKHRYGTLINALHLRYRRPDDPANDIQPKLGHRLDKETTGVLIVCKSDAARRSVAAQFEKNTVTKEYVALVEGRVATPEGVIEGALGPDPDSDIKMKQCVRADGSPASTRFEVVERRRDITLVRAIPRTGRQHQIRVHLKSIGHPILCDKLYGLRETLRRSEVRDLGEGEIDRVLIDRQALHAHRATLLHPATGREVTFETELPEDMATVLAEARR